MKDWLIEHKLYVVAAVLITLGSYYYFFMNEEAAPIDSINQVDKNLQSDGKETDQKNRTNQPDLPEKVMVDVKGQIKLPGVYLSTQGERVIDVINRAGGLTDQADQSQVNFAEHVQDEMVIYIPAKGEEGFTPPGSVVSPSSGASQNQGRININKADETELQKLPGIGPAKAAAIVEYRNTSGSFKAAEDLKNISGIGEKTFEKLKDLVAVQ